MRQMATCLIHEQPRHVTKPRRSEYHIDYSPARGRKGCDPAPSQQETANARMANAQAVFKSTTS
jgi:hypothetical protein